MEQYKGGRPPYYETPEELELAIDQYFKEGVAYRDVIVGSGKEKTKLTVQVPTITGLCIYLGFESRQSFYDYEKRAGFSYIVKRARLFIEKEYEEQLTIGNTTGAIFALKNFGWIDSQVFEHNIVKEKIQTVYDALQSQPDIPDSEPEQG